jgi:hypothetical protein
MKHSSFSRGKKPDEKFQPLITIILQAILTTTHSTSIPAVLAAPPPPWPTFTISCSAPPLPRDPTIPSKISQTLSLALSPNSTTTCAILPDPSPLPTTAPPGANASSYPSYFCFIHEDLHPWCVAGGIIRAMVDHARTTTNFHPVMIRGRAYIEHIMPAFQTRDLFTIWAILQLLRHYPRRVPDLDLIFDCVDWPVVPTDQYDGENTIVLRRSSDTMGTMRRLTSSSRTGPSGAGKQLLLHMFLSIVIASFCSLHTECNYNLWELKTCRFESILLCFDVQHKAQTLNKCL